MNKLKKIPFILFSFVFLAGCKETPTKPVVRVEVATATQRDVQDFIQSIGNVFEYSIVEIRPQVQGTLLKIHVKEGDYVKPGDLLFQIDPIPYQKSLEEAEAQLEKDKATLELAKSTVARYTEAALKDFVAPLNFEQYLTNLAIAQAQVSLDRAAVELAKINLDYCTIHAPIAGKVGIYNIFPGNLVVINDPNALIQIRQMCPADIRFTLPQRDFQEVERDRMTLECKINVFLPYEENRKFDGDLYFIDNHIDLQTGTILLKGKIPNEDLQLWPGQFVVVHLFTKMLANALVIPYSAIQIGQKGHFVYRVNESNTVEVVNVKIGPKSGNDVVILEGLQLGDKVVVNGQLNVRNGMEVSIVEKKEMAPT